MCNILIIDDDISTQNGLARRLQRLAKINHTEQLNIAINIIAPVFDSRDVTHLKKALTDGKYDAILCDFTLDEDEQTPVDLFFSYNDLDVPRDKPIWLYSGYDDLSEVVDDLRESYPNIDPEWLHRPFSDLELDDVLRHVIACDLLRDTNHKNGLEKSEKLLSFIPDNIALSTRDFNVPTRVINAEGRVVFSRNWPMARNQPSPQRYIKINNEISGFNPDSGTKYYHHHGEYYRIFSTFSPTQGDKDSEYSEDLLVQLALSVTESTYVADENVIRSVFERLFEEGFTRGRYYEVIETPGSDGLIKLAQWQPEKIYKKGLDEYSEDERTKRVGPVVNNILESFKREFLAYLKENCGAFDQHQVKSTNVIVIKHEASSLKHLMTSDDEFKILETMTDSEDGGTRIVVPIFLKGSETGKVSSFFIFDRKGAEKRERQIPKTHIESAKRTFSYLIPRIRDLIWRKDEIQRALSSEQITEFDNMLADITEMSDAENTLLKKACDLTEANSGILVRRHGQSNCLKVQTMRGISSNVEQGLRYPIKAESPFPIVRCWNGGTPIFEPFFQENNDFDSLLEQVPTIFPNSLGEQRDKRITSFVHWLETSVKATISLPVRFGGNTVGVITLHSNKSGFFDSQKVNIATRLISHCAGFMSAIHLAEQRKNWDQLFAHEVGTYLKPIRDIFELQMLGHIENASEAEKRAAPLIQILLDIKDAVLVIEKRRGNIDEGRFSPAEAINETLLLFAPYADLTSKNLVLPTTQNYTELEAKGSRLNFAMAVRILYQNAIKYSPQSGNIVIKTKVKDGIFKLQLINQGKLTDEELNTWDIPYYIPNERSHDGSHVALAASKILVNGAGGELTLENRVEGEQVVATIRWPLISIDSAK